MKNCKRWLTMTIGISLLFLTLTGISMYSIDPYNYYGNNHQQYLKDKPAFAAAAALRQEAYDTVILGSSLSLGISEHYVNNTMNCKSINLSYSGCTAQQRKIFIDTLSQTGKADIIICDLLLSNYADDGNQTINEMQMDSFPQYLFDDNIFNDIQYLYDFDIWFKMMPRIVVKEAAALLGRAVSNSYFQDYADFHKDSAWLPKEDWTEDFQNLQTINTKITFDDAAKITDAMKQNVDAYITGAVANNPEQQIIFYFPPYSALYWSEAAQKGYLDILLNTKKYIAESLAAYDNVLIYDFQTLDIVLDLQYYHDSLHYTEPINELIINLIEQQKCKIVSYNRQQDEVQIMNIISAFNASH